MSETAEQLLERMPARLDEDAIRTEMEAALAEEGRSLLRVAPEMGLKYGTVSTWRSGKYQGDTQRVAAGVQAWLNSRAARQRTHAALPPEPGFVMTKTASRVWEVAEFAQFTPTIGVVVGEAGVGKTCAFKGYQAQFPRTVWIATMHPFHSKIYPMLQQIGAALEMGRPGRTFELVQAIVHRLRDTRGLLILDEAQHLSVDALDQARSLSDEAGVGLLLGGNRQLLVNMGADRRAVQLAQIHSRIGMTLTLAKPLATDVKVLLDAWNVHGEQERGAATAIAMKPGGARVMTKVLRVAFGLAAAEGVDALAVEHIETAWAQLGSGERPVIAA